MPLRDWWKNNSPCRNFSLVSRQLPPKCHLSVANKWTPADRWMLLWWDVVEPYQIIKDKKNLEHLCVFIKYTVYLVLPSYNTFNLFTLSLWQSNSYVYSYIYIHLLLYQCCSVLSNNIRFWLNTISIYCIMVFSFVYSEVIIQMRYYIHRINHVSVYYAEIMEIFLGYVFFSSCVLYLLCPF